MRNWLCLALLGIIGLRGHFPMVDYSGLAASTIDEEVPPDELTLI